MLRLLNIMSDDEYWKKDKDYKFKNIFIGYKFS